MRLFYFIFAIALISCNSNPVLFETLPAEETGITFSNTVIQSGDNNVLKYPYYFNGGGVAIADFNNDQLPDIYFTGNSVPNKLYLNEGDFKFKDISEASGVSVPEGWKTGVTVADVNADGWLDLYVCRSAMDDSVMRKNLLFINNHNLTFTEQGAQFGIDDNSYSTGAAFFDYDKDGDPDLFVLNHSLPRYAGFNRLLTSFKNQKASKFQSKLYRNDQGFFHDVSEEAGIINNVLSFGLGLAVSDVNGDNWPDIYVSNDFNEEDYLFINNQNGTFTNQINNATGHVSLFSMGSDIADINNDQRPDIFTLDMLPESNERIKLSSGDDNYDKYRLLVNSGFHHQSMRNMLQLNNGDGTFSEIGQLAGISNSDWSWSTFFVDFDGDGFKDLYIGNGYEKDYTNMQFLKYTVDARIKANQTGVQPTVDEIIDNMPSIHVGNFLFKNNGDLTFTKTNDTWGMDRPFKSNGAAYADLDMDGDPDLVINTMNEPAVIMKNQAAEKSEAKFLKVDLTSKNPGKLIIGTKVSVFQSGKSQYQEFSPYRGFQSAMYTPLIFGVGNIQVDSIKISWPDNRIQVIKNPSGPVIQADQKEAIVIDQQEIIFKPLFKQENLIDWKHHPLDTNDFKRQILLPKMYSYSGPKIAVADINADGLDDVYLCGPQRQSGAIFIQQKDGSFLQSNQQAFEADKEFQDEDARFFDADSDGDQDLYVVSGGYEFSEKDPLLQDRFYQNDGAGNFARMPLTAETLSGSCVVNFDFEGDGDQDLFVGTRIIPGSYPASPDHLLLVNDGKGNFKQYIFPYNPGMISDAVAADLNGDKLDDLIIAGEWTSIQVYLNEKGSFSDATENWAPKSSGWWNTLSLNDFDGDGDQDLVAGNYGSNNQFHVDEKHPATLTFKDFNRDNQTDPYFCYFIGDKSYPYASRDEALGQVNGLKPRFPDYNSYANATLEDIFTEEELSDATTLEAVNLKSMYFENIGKQFKARALPVQAQFSPLYAFASIDIDSDGDLDLVTGGNETYTRVRIGKSDGNHGTVILNDGKGNFSVLDPATTGLKLLGDVRALKSINTPSGKLLVVGEIGQNIKTFSIK